MPGLCDAHVKELDLVENAYKRVCEYEADRAAILDFGINPALVSEIRMRQSAEDAESIEHPSRKTFMRIHPFGYDRARQAAELDRDIELRRRYPVKINWAKLASEFLA